MRAGRSESISHDGFESEYSVKSIIGLALKHRRALIVANIIALAAVVASIPLPLILPLLVDEVLLDQPGSLVAVFGSLVPSHWLSPYYFLGAGLVLTVFLRIVSTSLNVWQTRKFVGVAKDVVFTIRGSLLHRLQRVSMSAYESLGGGTVSSHLVTDLNTIDDFVGSTISKFIVAVLSIIGTAAVLIWIHWPLALFILFMNPVVIYFTVQLGKKVKNLKKKENSAFALFQETLTETLDNIQQVRASNREQHYFNRVVGKAGQVAKHSAAFSWKSDAANRLSFLVFLIGFDVFRVVSMLMVLLSGLTVGKMMAVFAYLWFMMVPVQDVLNIQYAYYAALAALKRINRLASLPLEPQYPQLHNPFVGNEPIQIELENVSFSYHTHRPVLSNVNLVIEPGERVALVGASGGGKSTLAQILLGLYLADSGVIRFSGIPIDKIGLHVVRENVSCVLQHPAIFNDTVRANLTMGRSLSDQQCWQALEVAQLDQTIAQMPAGLDSVVGSRGVRLSGGQRQRLAIARLVLANPKVVILDEATSALDAETERSLHQRLSGFLGERTTLIIAHRLSAVRQADRVLVFEDGHIAEQGSHDQLIKAQGLYTKLVGTQQRIPECNRQ